jgi:aspartate aminotransferase/aminotransferase
MHEKDLNLASRMERIEGSGVRRMFELVSSMENPINLSIGQADYDAPSEMKEAAVQAIREGKNRYTVTQGIPALIEGVLDRIERREGFRPESAFMTSGVSGGLLLSALALLDPGDLVLLPDPFFVMYKNVLEMVGAKVVFFDLYPKEPGQGWQPDLDEIQRLFAMKPKLLLLNSPSNPTGGILSAKTLDFFTELASKYGTWILSDEIYDHFSYDGTFPSMVPRMRQHERCIVLGGFSKTWGVPGWRLGWAMGPDAILDKMRLLQQYTFVCCPTPLQYGAVAGIDLEMAKELDSYRKKRDLVFEGLGDLYELEKSQGSFYAFPAYPKGWTEKAFIQACLERRLLLVPGSAFSRKATHFRISFAANDRTLEEGIEVLRSLAK